MTPVELLRRVIAEKRRLVAMVGLLFVVDCTLYVLAVYPWSNKVVQAEMSTTAVEAQLQESRQAYAVATETSEKMVAANEELARFYRDVLPADLAGARAIIFSYLEKMAADADLILERQTSVPEQEQGSLLARLRTTMVLAGEYQNIRQFMYRLETASEFILIEEVVLGQDTDSDAQLVLTLGASTYYWVGADATS